MNNAFSVDLEDWFCSHNLAIPYSEWPHCEWRIQQSTERLLLLLDRYHIRATFFVLGWVAERFPALVARIYRLGHEIGSHGYSHRLLTHMTQQEFEADLIRSLAVLRDITGLERFGYRAPAFTLVRSTLGAVDILQRHGVLYDSSVFPIALHPDYGMPDAPADIYLHNNGLPEVPISTVSFGRWRIPCGGGGYFRQLPYKVSQMLLRRCHTEGRPIVFYVHPWEIDPSFPHVQVSPGKWLRSYRNLATTESKLVQLVQEFRFTTISAVLAERLGNTQGGEHDNLFL